MLLAVTCVVKTLHAQHSFPSYKDVSEADGPDMPPMNVVTPREADFIDSSPHQMQIAHFQSRGFLDDANDVIYDAQSAFKDVQSYVKKAGIIFRSIFSVNLLSSMNRKYIFGFFI